jgi:hypothetical protein
MKSTFQQDEKEQFGFESGGTSERSICKSSVLGVIGMAQVRTRSGLVRWRLEVRLHARSARPLDGALFGIA